MVSDQVSFVVSAMIHFIELRYDIIEMSTKELSINIDSYVKGKNFVLKFNQLKLLNPPNLNDCVSNENFAILVDQFESFRNIFLVNNVSLKQCLLNFI